MKQCIRCKQTKELSAFHKHKGMKDGHLNKCAVCVKECVAEWRLNNPDARKKEHARIREKEGFLTIEEYHKKLKENAKGRKQICKDYYEKNKKAIREYQKKWRAANPDKVKAKRERLSKTSKYKATKCAAQRKREANKLKRTPAWAEHEKIQAYYNVCSFFNEVNGYIKYHVDHIVPLQGKTVSGLHVHNNLQVILAEENLKKHNTWSGY